MAVRVLLAPLGLGRLGSCGFGAVALGRCVLFNSVIAIGANPKMTA